MFEVPTLSFVLVVAKTTKNVFINSFPPDIGNLTTASLKLFHLGTIEKRTTSYKSNFPYRSFALRNFASIREGPYWNRKKEGGRKYSYWKRCGGAVTSWLVRSTLHRVVRIRVLAEDIVLCSWARHYSHPSPPRCINEYRRM